MLGDKKIKELQNRISNYIKEGVIKKDNKIEYVNFFLQNANKSLISAELLYKVSTDKNTQETIGFRDFEGHLWVINASYYSMFYLARALLESRGIKLEREVSIHLLTFDVLVYYFYLSGKLEKKFIEYYVLAEQEAAQLLGKEKAEKIIKDYLYEKNKRGEFTYDLGVIAIKAKAKTSLERARVFNEELQKILL